MSVTDKKNILAWMDANHKVFDELALTLWANPETAFEEKDAVRLQMALLRERGFTVTQKDGAPTAFMAEWGEGGPVIGVLGEYDALGGLSQTVSAAVEPVKEGAPGHGCGHNLLGVGGLFAACAAKEAFAAQGIKGVIRYYGCPGEEQLTGKGLMARLGYFEGTDVSLAWHPNDFSYITGSTMTAMFSAKFTFFGKASHAGAAPHAGRSALDAVELMNVGANYLREHMLDQNRLHYVITNGGVAPNIVPQEAEVWYFGRATHSEELASMWQRLNNVARGAAAMTETSVKVTLLGGCYNTLPNKALNAVLEDNLIHFAGKIPFDDQDFAFAEKIRAGLPLSQVAAALAKSVPVPEDSRLLDVTPLPCCDSGTFMMGSTDVGDVAHIMPTSMMWGATWPIGVPHHSWQAVACAGSPIGLKGTLQAAKTLAGTMYDLARNPSLVAEARKEFEEQRGGQAYRPIEELLG